MQWVKEKSNLHVARGKIGTFEINIKRRSGMQIVWARYFSPTQRNVTFPPFGSVKAAKAFCEDSAFWETEGTEGTKVLDCKTCKWRGYGCKKENGCVRV